MSHIKSQICWLLNICWVRLQRCRHELIKIARTQTQAMRRLKEEVRWDVASCVLSNGITHTNTQHAVGRGRCQKTGLKWFSSVAVEMQYILKSFLKPLTLSLLSFLCCSGGRLLFSVGKYTKQPHKLTPSTKQQVDEVSDYLVNIMSAYPDVASSCWERKKLYKSSVGNTTCSTKQKTQLATELAGEPNRAHRC